MNLEMLRERPLSFTSIKEFQKSPRHYIEYISKERTPPTDAMKLGSMVHCMMLQPELFNDQFAVMPDVNRRTNAGKEEYAEFVSKNADKTVVDNSSYEHARRLADTAMSRNEISQLVNGCLEFELEWSAEIDDLPYRGFYDGVASDYILEIKTTADGYPRKVMSDFLSRKYHMQAGLYHMASEKPIIYVIVETSEPYLSYAAPADDSYVKMGCDDIGKLNEQFNKCLKKGDFSGGYDYNGEILIRLPWDVDK
jgi:exodeoxyribonuclease VIII